VVRQLHELNYRVFEADTVAEAIAAIEREAIDVARVAVAKAPATRVVVTSGFPRTDYFEQAGGLTNVRLLPKPCRSEDLNSAVRDVPDG
jgi:DNA-binding NarL/FixJ family response regulator